MTIISSLHHNKKVDFFEKESVKKHRSHRSKKNRKIEYGLAFKRDLKRRIEREKIESMDRQIYLKLRQLDEI